MKKHSKSGTVGALLDEYEKFIPELNDLLASMNESQLIQVIDHETKDKDYRSVQTIMTHVIPSGYNYTDTTRNKYVGRVEFKIKDLKSTLGKYRP